ncbi:MAG: hypothetical protein CSB48_05815 [Proteobacteria bacterium]|nr:MAG: hypothetical protein CSB48_05815 [Pseudomonadota bacterium]
MLRLLANADHYDIISYETGYPLAQKQASLVVIEERWPVAQKKATKRLMTAQLLTCWCCCSR